MTSKKQTNNASVIEAEKLAKKQEAEKLAKQKEAEKLAKKQEAEKLAKQKEAEKLAKKQEAEKLAKLAEQQKSAALEVLGEIIAQIKNLSDNELDTQIKAGELFASVKNGGDVKLAYGSFRKFCEQTPYHFTTVYLLVNIVENPTIKANYKQLGQLKAKMLLDSKLTSQDDINFAIANKTKDVKDYIDGKKEIQEVEAVESETNLANLLAQKEAIRTKIMNLQSQIAYLQDDMAVIDSRIAELSK